MPEKLTRKAAELREKQISVKAAQEMVDRIKSVALEVSRIYGLDARKLVDSAIVAIILERLQSAEERDSTRLPTVS